MLRCFIVTKYFLHVIEQLSHPCLPRIDTGESSEILNTRPKGNKPEVPEVHRFVELTSSSISLHLRAWKDGGCPINYFVVEYKARCEAKDHRHKDSFYRLS